MGELYDVPGVTGRHSFSGSRVMVRALLRGRRGRDCTRAFRGRVWTARRVIVHSDGPPCLARVRWTLGVYGGHGTDLPWCVWRTRDGLACVWETRDGLACVWRTRDGLALVCMENTERTCLCMEDTGRTCLCMEDTGRTCLGIVPNAGTSGI